MPKPKLDVLSWAPRIFHAENLLTPGVHVHEKHAFGSVVLCVFMQQNARASGAEMQRSSW